MPPIEPVVVDERREAVLAAVPDVPDEGAILEHLAVRLEELVAKPGVEIRLLRARGCKELAGTRRRPGRSIGASEELLQTLGRRTLAKHRGKTDDAVAVGELGRVVRLGLLGPAVAEESTHCDLQRLGRDLGSTLEEPLGRVVRPRLGKRAGFLGDAAPVVDVEGDFRRASRSSTLIF